MTPWIEPQPRTPFGPPDRMQRVRPAANGSIVRPIGTQNIELTAKNTKFGFFVEFGWFGPSAARPTMTRPRAQSRRTTHVARARWAGLDCPGVGVLHDATARRTALVFFFFGTWRRSNPLRYGEIFWSYKHAHVTAVPPKLARTRTSPSRVASCLRSAAARRHSAAWCAADPVRPRRQLAELLLLAVDAPLATEFRVQAVDLQSQLRDLLLKCEHA